MPAYTNIFIRITGTPSNLEDTGIPGLHLITVPTEATSEQAATAALDALHEAVPITVLDDFTLTLHNADGDEIQEGEAGEEKATGCYVGKIEPDALTHAARARIYPEEWIVPGTRVRFTEQWDAYPNTLVRIGETGTIVSLQDCHEVGVEVKLDEYHDGLDEWKNVIHIQVPYPEAGGLLTGPGFAAARTATFLLYCEPLPEAEATVP